MTRSKVYIILAFIAIYIVWGSTYMFNKIAVTQLSPLYLASIRFSVAGVLMLGLAVLLKHEIKLTRRELLNSLIAGFLFLVYGNGVFVWALKYVDSGFGALIASTQPLFVLGLMRLIDRKPLRKKSIIGVVLGISGMYLLVSQKDLVTSEDTLLGIFMMLSCVLFWSYGSVFVSKAKLPKSYLVTTSYQMLIASVLLLLLSIGFNEPWILPNQWSTDVLLAMLFLIVFGGIVAFTSFNYLLKKVSAEKVATSAYMNPVIALFLGWYFLEEQLSNQSLVASGVLLLGVYFITTRKK